MLGGAEKNRLWETDDGGSSWAEVAFPDQPLAERYRLTLPAFSTKLAGAVAMMVEDGGKTAVRTYTTDDGGVSWQLVTSQTVSVEFGQPVPLAANGLLILPDKSVAR